MTHESARQKSVYDSDARRYDALVSAEDCEGNLGRVLESVATLAGRCVLDVGAGTGRVTRLLTAAGAEVFAVDRAAAMIAVAVDRGASRAAVADARSLPFREDVCDVVCAGWVFGHFPHWSPESWRDDAGRALAEMNRVVRPGGSLLLLETLGTAAAEPSPPTASLAEYYRWLEDERGFECTVLRTDYRFPSPEEAVRLCEFFFGETIAAKVGAAGSERVPEYTGLWHRTV